MRLEYETKSGAICTTYFGQTPKLGYPAYAAVDAYFGTGPAFATARQYCMDTGKLRIYLIVPAKKSYVAYLSKQKTQANRVKLWTRFSCLQLFTDINA